MAGTMNIKFLLPNLVNTVSMESGLDGRNNPSDRQ